MSLGNNNYYRDLEALHDKCKKYLNYHVVLTMEDGSTFDGFIEDVDMNGITMWVGEDIMDEENENQYDQQRQFQRPRRRRRRFRRFRRRRFPLNLLARLFLLPYPYWNPPYPYDPYSYYDY